MSAGDNNDNTIPEGTMVPLYHPWCPPGFPFPESYDAAIAADPARCVASDPCSGDGVSTLWTLQPCEVAPSTSSSVPVVVSLPATGGTVGGAGVALCAVLVGAVLVRVARRAVTR